VTEHPRNETKQFVERRAPVASTFWDPSHDCSDWGLLSRLAEEMYGELAFARAAHSLPGAAEPCFLQRDAPLFLRVL